MSMYVGGKNIETRTSRSKESLGCVFLIQLLKTSQKRRVHLFHRRAYTHGPAHVDKSRASVKEYWPQKSFTVWSSLGMDLASSWREQCTPLSCQGRQHSICTDSGVVFFEWFYLGLCTLWCLCDRSLRFFLKTSNFPASEAEARPIERVETSSLAGVGVTGSKVTVEALHQYPCCVVGWRRRQ